MTGLETADKIIAFLKAAGDVGVTSVRLRSGDLELEAVIEAGDPVTERVRMVLGEHPEQLEQLEEILAARQEERIKFHSSDDD